MMRKWLNRDGALLFVVLLGLGIVVGLSRQSIKAGHASTRRWRKNNSILTAQLPNESVLASMDWPRTGIGCVRFSMSDAES